MQTIKYFLTLVLILLAVSCKNETKKQPVRITKHLLYIGTYTEKEAHVEGKAAGVYIYEFDTASGKLDYVNTSPATINPSYVTLSPDGKYLYAVNETGSADTGGYVSAFSLSDSGRSLVFINRVSSKGDYPCFIETDKTGKYAFCANYGSGTVAMFPVANDGSLGEAVFTDKHKGKGATSRQESAHAHSVRISPDNKFAYSCDLGTDEILVYAINTAKGKLDPVQILKTEAGAGPRHLDFHPSLNLMYVINELNGTIQCLSRDESTDKLEGIQVISTSGDSLRNDAGSADIHIAPSGDFLYASNRGPLNNIAIFAVDKHSGKLSYRGTQSVKGEVPRNFAIDPSGKWILVANQNSGQVVSFRIDPVSGALKDSAVITDIPTPVCIKFKAAR